MPIYEYRCDDCSHAFEMLQKFSDAPVETCELCGGPLRKVLHPVAIHFKGSGFYTTDYANKTSSPPSSSGGGGNGDGCPAASAEKEKPAAPKGCDKNDPVGCKQCAEEKRAKAKEASHNSP